MQSVRKGPTLALADVFANDSDNEQTFYGFTDNDISDHGNKASKFKKISKINTSPSLQNCFVWLVYFTKDITCMDLSIHCHLNASDRLCFLFSDAFNWKDTF